MGIFQAFSVLQMTPVSAREIILRTRRCHQYKNKQNVASDNRRNLPYHRSPPISHAIFSLLPLQLSGVIAPLIHYISISRPTSIVSSLPFSGRADRKSAAHIEEQCPNRFELAAAGKGRIRLLSSVIRMPFRQEQNISGDGVKKEMLLL